MPLQPPFLQAEQAHFPQPFLTGQVLQPPTTLVVSAERASGYLCLSCMGGGVTARLDAVLQMQSNKHCVEGDNHTPQSAG